METVSEGQGISRSLSSGKTYGEDMGSAGLSVEFDKLTELDVWLAPIYWSQQMYAEIKRLKAKLDKIQFAIDSTIEKPPFRTEFHRGWNSCLEMIQAAKDYNEERKTT